MSTEQSKAKAADATGKQKTPIGKTASTNGRERDVGHALRSIYQKTIEETVPPEMLDLLGKLD